MRPHRGVHLTVSRFGHPLDPMAGLRLARFEAETVPALLATTGVAGVSTYALHSDGAGFGDAGGAGRGTLVRIVHLDGDPVDAAPAVGALLRPDAAATEIEHVVWSGPLRTITPGSGTGSGRPDPTARPGHRGGPMRIEVDRDCCISAGACILEAEDLFDQDDNGVVVLLVEAPDPTRLNAARAAAEACPAAAITVVD
ncbi:ferredoxin [Pseudonocardia sp. NPDC049154]|uniref:ferredoxin n=1 Tax=Pseudonocardia sp. NPDC049154 TaxID=3155501 RepID=UPI0033FB541C